MLLFALAACAPDSPFLADDDGAFWDAPFPADSRRHGDGTVDVSGWPNPDGIPWVERLRALVDGQTSGFGRTSGIVFPVGTSLELAPLTLEDTVADDALAYLQALGDGSRVPVEVAYVDDGRPFAPRRFVSLLPLQGVPLQAKTSYAAVIRRGLAEPPLPRFRGELPEGLDDADVAALTVFTTGDPATDLAPYAAAMRADGLSLVEPLALVDEYDGYCVLQGLLDLPDHQRGDPPYLDAGGGLSLDVQKRAPSRLVVTVPRGPGPYPTAVFVRTGGGGDRPLVDRGVRDATGAAEPGTGFARDLAAIGVAGVQVDGPHGGPRNVSHGDEQFLMFNVTNPEAMRDNVRESALELALLPDLLGSLELSACPGATGGLDASHLALIGHSMGATIAPLTLALEPRYDAVVLSGAGGSYLENVLHKQSPIAVRPVAEATLRYDPGQLHRTDPILALVQWAAEPADPPVYAEQTDADVLMLQGIVDTYILPPIANTTTLSLGLDLGGDALDGDARLADFTPIADLLPLVGRGRVALPVTANSNGRTRVLLQLAEDGVEDGHEVMFQLPDAHAQVRCFLASWAGGAPAIGC